MLHAGNDEVSISGHKQVVKETLIQPEALEKIEMNSWDGMFFGFLSAESEAVKKL